MITKFENLSKYNVDDFVLVWSYEKCKILKKEFQSEFWSYELESLYTKYSSGEPMIFYDVEEDQLQRLLTTEETYNYRLLHDISKYNL